MRAGRFLRVPERPDDVARLWQEAVNAHSGSPARYRHISTVSSAGLSAAERATLAEEVREAQLTGLFVEQDRDDASLTHVYVPGPAEAEVFSIGILRGPSPFELSAPRGVTNPVLTAADVSDVTAAYVADPFMVRHDGSWHMFFEILDWHSDKGCIGLAVSKDGTEWEYRGIVLAEPFHLSYPHVFAADGEWYMAPESHQAGCVRLYRARSFPWDWTPVTTLVEGPHLADASVLYHDRTWWLFVEANPTVRHDTLRLFYADRLTGPWREHPESPVIDGDPSLARPAGRLIVTGGRILRFAQCCTPAYGTDVRAREITTLSRTHYSERAAAPAPLLGPSGAGWNAAGMHHIDAHRVADRSWLACVDGWRRVNGWASRGDPEAEARLRLLVREDIEPVVPPGALFVLVDKGLGVEVSQGRRFVPFPEHDGVWNGYPADDAQAIAELERLIGLGASFLVVPAPMAYWLDTYPGLHARLRERGRRVVDNERAVVFTLS